ncbi:MAG: methyltransferase domain-containing protein [Deltaproteobacteria bacterium]|nr:methyltransferase domain-containing protein [Deltaproteobacteria bacterium]
MKPWNPQEYDAWYETPLGILSDRLEKELVFSLIDIKPGERVLDIGCGTGNYTVEVAKRVADVIGIDSSEEMLGWARIKAQKADIKASFKAADAMNLPFPDSSFDAVLSNGLLCFLKEPEKALMEMRRVLKPGGRLVVGVLNRWSLWALFRRVKGLIKDTIYNQAHFISPPELEGLIRGAGFHVKEARTCLFFFPVNNRVYLKIAEPFERLDRVLIPRTGAFLAISAVKQN